MTPTERARAARARKIATGGRAVGLVLSHAGAVRLDTLTAGGLTITEVIERALEAVTTTGDGGCRTFSRDEARRASLEVVEPDAPQTPLSTDLAGKNAF